MKISAFFLFLVTLAAALLAGGNGVIETATGNLLRGGYVSTNSWATDGAFDASAESVVSGIPHPFYYIGNPTTNTFHRLTNGVWIVVSE